MKDLTRRRSSALSLFLLWVIFGAAGLTVAEESNGTAEESRFVRRARQLTFEGRRAGEGYFSTDGRRLVFQSEREPDNPFYQIYLLDFETGETSRISPGQGKTTCAFLRPGSGEILFASTHHDPRSEEYQQTELELRASGRERRYAWDFDPEMELYVAPGASGDLTRLTDSRGYDAEGSYSPSGEWIVFSSNRSAYDGELAAEDLERLKTDPSFFLEIYLMRADGSEPRRLTREPGYDGGPFFSPDGERIIWRRFEPGGVIADIWSMKLDGSDQRRLTQFASMSWAPYPHPSGEYILFTSNKLGFDNFELFVVDTGGMRQPVRVTFTPGFDGLPVPSPDGRKLAWTTNRNGESAQIWLAEWDHEQALTALREAPPRSSAAPGGAGATLGSIGDKLIASGAGPLPGNDSLLGPDDSRLLAYWPARVDAGAGAAGAGAIVVTTCLDDPGSSSADTALALGEQLAHGRLARPVLLAIWTGDGSGCPPQEAIASDSGIPLARIVAGVDISGVGRVRDNRLALGGVSSSSVWPGLIERSNAVHGFDVQVDAGVEPESTAAWLHAKGIPAVAVKTYPGDGAGSPAAGSDQDATRAARFIALFVRKLAALDKAPEYRETASGGPPAAARGKGRPFTGTIPDYAGGGEGLRLEGVVEGGPAARAGIRAGDVIVELGGVEISGIEDYARALDGLTIGQPVQVVLRRDGRTIKVEITPGRRD